MLKLLRFWWRFDEPVDRGRYLRHGVALMALKFAGDAAIVWLFTGRQWWIGDYVRPFANLVHDGSAGYYGLPAALMPTLALWTLPFLWIGITLTGRRLADAALPMALVLLFFVPWLNYALMLSLCVVPSRRPVITREGSTEWSSMPRGAAWTVAIASGATLSGALIFLSVYWLHNYSAGLFLGAPFLASTVTGWVLARSHPAATQSDSVRCSILMLLSVALATLAIGAEGLVCVVMATPLAGGLGYFGGVLGYELGRRAHHQRSSSVLGLMVIPMVFLTGSTQPAVTATHQVLSSVEIDAPPEVVWPRVIAFSPIDPPSDWMFRAGVAYPVRARIEGTGVGAIRYCEFSTGAFVEPITAWDTNRRLAFDVSESPAPMRELTPYAGVAPPHLKGFLTSKRGEFRLIALGNGRTRLEGRTWYTIDMGPEAYWQLYADRIIHHIHLRVLDHIKHEAELAPR